MMKIMVCYDGSDEAKAGLKEAEKFARAFSGEVLVVVSHLVGDDKFDPRKVDKTESGLKETQMFFDECGIPCKTSIEYRGVENTGEHLLLVAERERVDEIIVGIKSRSKIGKLVLGSVAQFLILNADCPVVGVKKRHLTK